MVLRKFQRSFEGSIGALLIRKVEEAELRKSGLKHKTVSVKGRDQHYLESNPDGEKTFIIFYGMTQRMEQMAAFVNGLKLPSTYRILIPEAVGHGRDIPRVLEQQQFPSRIDLLDGLDDWMNHLQIEHAVAFGPSMGGAAAYHLSVRNPNRFDQMILISPAIESVVDPIFIREFENGTKAHLAFETRESLKVFFRDMAPPNRTKRDPVPKFFLQGIIKLRNNHLKSHNTDYYGKLLKQLNTDIGMVEELSASKDELPDHVQRLIIWPVDDACCNYTKGKEFFADSKCKFVPISNAGHIFRGDGEPLHLYCLPEIRTFLEQP
jgi:pimeloyl-ACP methyl ester carboxylesterase